MYKRQDIGTEAEQRKQFITETEHRIAELEQQVEKGRDIDAVSYTHLVLKLETELVS